MITIALMGGLGNQLFQFALGRTFEHRGQEVQYDTALFDHDPGRRYLLDQLGLKLRLSHHGGTGQIIREGSMRYKPELLDLKGEATLIGYWQSSRYIDHIGDEIRDAICLYPSPSEKSIEVSYDIVDLEELSCFVHIRRSDNLRTAGVEVHGLLTAPGCLYYERAMNCMRERVPGVHFFMFSDDPRWCEQNFRDADVTVVGHNAPSFTVDDRHDIHFQSGGREVEDLWLMSLCRHAIIANSTFSWWGAWLNPCEGVSTIMADGREETRIVYAPEPWFHSRELDSADIVPERWGKIAIR